MLFYYNYSSRSNLSLPPSLAETQRSGTPHSFCGHEFEERPSTPTPQQSPSPPRSVSGATASGDREMPSSRSRSPLTTSTQQLRHTQDMSLVPLLNKLNSDNRKDAKINILENLQDLWKRQEHQQQQSMSSYNPPVGPFQSFSPHVPEQTIHTPTPGTYYSAHPLIVLFKYPLLSDYRAILQSSHEPVEPLHETLC